MKNQHREMLQKLIKSGYEEFLSRPVQKAVILDSVAYPREMEFEDFQLINEVFSQQIEIMNLRRI